MFHMLFRGEQMANKTYELTYIVNGVLSDDQIRNVVQRVNNRLKDFGADVIESDEWGTRRLAYPIRKKRNGYYVNVYFTAPPESVARLERALEIDDDILRYLTLVMDAKMLRYYEKQRSSTTRARAQEGVAVARGRREEDEDED